MYAQSRKYKSRGKTRRALRCALISLILLILLCWRTFYAPIHVSFGSMALSALHKVNDVSAVYTPYHLTPGGGERVLLIFVRVLQHRMKGHLDLVVTNTNVCQSVDCVRKLAETLDVRGIDWNRFSVKRLNKARDRYDIWFAMGNSLLPEVASRGAYSLYHCQFPFDGTTDAGELTALRRLSTYDVVYLNSRYTESWYHRYLNEKRESISLQQHTSDSLLLPKVLHFPPHFDVYAGGAKKRNTVRHIVVVGRVFQGVQSKRHDLAIQAFKRLRESLKTNKQKVKLSLVGHIATGHEEYAEFLRNEAAKVENVHTHFNASPNVLRSVISEADMVWSITGLDTQHTSSPADAEHFGIALLECMSAGLVPIVANVGGPTETLEGFPEYLRVDNIDQLVSSSQFVMSARTNIVQDLSTRAIERALELSTAFENDVDALFSFLGEKKIPANELEWLALKTEHRTSEEKYTLQPPGTKKCPSIHDDKYAIVYLETRFDLALRATAFHVVRKLGNQWRFHVWTSHANTNFVKHSLEGIPCVVFHWLSDKKTSYDPRVEGDYQSFWKSEQFIRSLGDSVQSILNFQADAWFPPKSRFLKTWTSFDYIGAPWCHEGNWGYLPIEHRPNDAIRMLHDTRQLPYDLRVGNGGISLRSVPAMLQSVRAKKSSRQENEDVFYVLSMIELGKHVAATDVAARFSAEILCEDIRLHKRLTGSFHSLSQGRRVMRTELIPFALHKPFDLLRRLCGKSSNRPLNLCLETFVEMFFKQ